MLTALGRWSQRWTASIDPWTNVYGLARTLIAGVTAMTLLANPTHVFFRPAAGVGTAPFCTGIRQYGLFCEAHGHLDLARWIAIAVLVLVASGWRPRITGVLHWFVAASLQSNAIGLDGGEQVAAVLTLILVPVTLTDGRRWHWNRPENKPLTELEHTARFVALVALTLARVQVAGIYFHAAVAKVAVEQWANGTALYYWLIHPSFGAPSWFSGLVHPFIYNPVPLALLTWSVLVVEYVLSAALFFSKDRRWIPLAMGLALHAGIMALHGLISFSTIMFAALILYLRPVENVFVFRLQLIERIWANAVVRRSLVLASTLLVALTLLTSGCSRAASHSSPDAAPPSASPVAKTSPPASERAPSAPALRQSEIALPLRGKAFVAWGGSTLATNKHVLQPSQRRAVDLLVKSDDDGRSFRGDGTRNADYFVYGREVLAVADGTVLTVIDGIPDNEPGAINPLFATGNTVVIQHGPALFSAYGHLQPRHMRVKVGDVVHRGAILGACGNSGNSSEAHLHLQLEDGPRLESSWGIEPVLTGIQVTRNGETTASNAYTFSKGDVVEQLPAPREATVSLR